MSRVIVNGREIVLSHADLVRIDAQARERKVTREVVAGEMYPLPEPPSDPVEPINPAAEEPAEEEPAAISSRRRKG